MPAQSKQQQKFMGMVHALKKGDMKPSDASPELKKAAQSMSDKDAKDFASTPHKGLPKKVKQEILNKLKEYANSMGRDHLGGDDYTSSKKGGLRDFDGYDNVDYNPEMKQEGKLPGNWMQGRVSDYHTSLRGKKKDYSGGTNFRTDNSGQEDLEEAGLKGIENIPSNKKLSQLSDNEKLSIIQSVGNIISFHVPDWAKGRYKFWQVISAGKVKKGKSLSGETQYFLQGKGPQKASPTYKSVKDLINGVDWNTMELRRESVKEYGQRLDLSYLEDEEARLDGTPKPKDAIDRNIDETMIRRASDIAQKLIPMDTWSRHASFQDGGKKNKEFVKNIVRDLAQSLNRFYKSHDINVRIQENEGDSNVDMVLGVLSILRQIDDKENRKRVAVDMIKKFKEQDIDFDYREFIDLMKEYSMGSYEYSK